MQQLTDFYIMLIDGRCQIIPALSKAAAISKAAEMFDWDDDDDEDDFISKINFIEWKDDSHYLENCMDNKREEFSKYAPYFLSQFLNLKLTE